MKYKIYDANGSLKNKFAEMRCKEIQDKAAGNKQIKIAHMQHGYTLKEIAEQLKIHYTTVSKVLKS